MTLRAGGFRSQIHLWGDQSAEPVFLLHDGMYGADALTAWENVAPQLEDSFRVIAPDLLGFGTSDKVVFLDRPPYASRLDQIEALYDVLDLDRPCHLVGSSFGGSLALRALERARLPIASVTAISGTGGPWRTADGKTALGDYAEPSVEAMARLLHLVVDPYEGFERLAERRFKNTLLPGHYEAIASMGLRNPVESTHARQADEYPETLAQTTTPVLLIAGENDTLLEPGWMQNLAQYLPQSPVECATRLSGHCPNIDHPQDTAKLIKNFLMTHRHDPPRIH